MDKSVESLEAKLKLWFNEWKSYGEIRLPLIDIDTGYRLMALVEKYEPHQYKSSIYTEEHDLCIFYKAMYKKACEEYPITMKRAEYLYFISHFK